MTVFIDADGCPVVDIAVGLSRQAKAACVILCDTAHVFEKEGARTITVSQGSDSVDFALVNMLQKGDIVITQDYGLAAMCLARCAYPIHQDGMVYSEQNITSLLMQRHTAQKIRMAGGRLKGAAKRTKAQDDAFEMKFKLLLQEVILKCEAERG